MSKKILILVALIATNLLSQEISVYGAGLNSNDNPYGLTKDEKNLLEKNKKVAALDRNMGSVQSQINELKEKIEGIISIVESNSIKINEINSKLSMLEHSNQDQNISHELQELKTYVKKSRAIESKNNKNIKKTINQLSKLIDQDTQNKSTTKKVETINENIPSSKLLEKAKYYYNKKNYDTSKRYFEILVTKYYKPAECNFYLGEIAYFQKKYKRAISHYKESVGLYDKANYIPKLLYHTAISYDKLKNQSEANKFYNALKTNYPNSKEAKASPIRK